MTDPDSSQGEASRPSGSHLMAPGKGFLIGEYTIEKTLGHGSMAAVYLARDNTGHDVALKVFQEGPGVSATMLERFRREAEAAKKLRRHPNIMKVYATGRDGPYHYIVMEAVSSSRTLDDVITGDPLDVTRIVTIIIKIARALHFAHTRNIVHRDVKPTNIMIDEFGEPLLTDFGVAALIDWPTCTITGALTGTPLYMSPEQARAEQVGPESDVYSLAVVLYEALTGYLPYTAQHSDPVKSVLEAVKNELPKRPRALRKDLSPDLEAVIMKALEKEPQDRYHDGDAFAHDLERALAGRHVHARLFSFRDRMLFLVRRNQKTVAAAMALLALLGALSLYYRNLVINARYETLLTFAQLRSFALSMAHSDEADPSMRQRAGAWPEMRQARRAMNRGAWSTAGGHLESALQFTRDVKDTRTEAMALLDLARLRALGGQHDEALNLLLRVLDNPDASPPVLHQALLESLFLNLLHDRHAEAQHLIANHPLPSDNLFRNAMLCLTGEITPERYVEQIAYLPARLQNDAHFALAIRYRMNGDLEAWRFQLREAVRRSMPGTEWPGPLARQLYAEDTP